MYHLTIDNSVSVNYFVSIGLIKHLDYFLIKFGELRGSSKYTFLSNWVNHFFLVFLRNLAVFY